MIGRHQDKENIVERLMHPADGQNVSVILIVGISSLGKTVIAKLAFNDARVVDHFELKCWVCVFNELVLKQLLVKMIRSITSDDCKDLDEV